MIGPPPRPGEEEVTRVPDAGRASVAGSRSAEPDAAFGRRRIWRAPPPRRSPNARAASFAASPSAARARLAAPSSRSRRWSRRCFRDEEIAALRAAPSAAARIDGLESDRDARRRALQRGVRRRRRVPSVDRGLGRGLAYVERRFESAWVDAEARVLAGGAGAARRRRPRRGGGGTDGASSDGWRTSARASRERRGRPASSRWRRRRRRCEGGPWTPRGGAGDGGGAEG